MAILFLHPARLVPVTPTGGSTPSHVVTKSPGLQILGVIPSLLCRLSEVNPLGPLPRLDAQEEEKGRDKDNPPFPADPGMFEDIVVDDRDIQGRKDGNETRGDSPEQEAITPEIVHPLSKVSFAPWLHTEEAATHIDHLPGQEERKPSQTGETGSASTENRVTSFRIAGIAVLAQIAVTKSVEDKAEGG